MNATLYKNGLKSSWKPLVLFAAVMTMYFTVIITMFDPELGGVLQGLANAMPELMALMGMTSVDTTLAGFMASYLYGFLVPIIPMVFAIIAGNSLVAKRVDSGAMAYLLAAPVPRRKIVLTQTMVLLTGVTLLVAFSAAIGIVAGQAYFPGALDVPKFLLLNLGALALHLLISGICFFASCLFNDTKYSLAVGAGVPALAFIIQMIVNAGGMENIKYATFFTLFNPSGIIGGEAAAYGGIVALAIAGLVLYAAANVVFVKKDVPV